MLDPALVYDADSLPNSLLEPSNIAGPPPAVAAPNVFEDSRWARGLLICIGLGLALLLSEVGARVLVAVRWPPEKVLLYTSHSRIRGRFLIDAGIGYRGTPGFRDRQGRFRHNDYGFRGAPFSVAKSAGTVRIVLMGASTIYGVVDESQTSAVQLAKRLQHPGSSQRVEVLNGGLAGWTSYETVRHLEQRVVDLAPDVVIVLDGRNEIFPELFRNYREDYSHFRDPHHNTVLSNYWYKKLFRVSHLAMLLATGGRGHLGFHSESENPAYASIRSENRPSEEEMIRFSRDPARLEGYRRNLAREIGIAHARGITIALATMPFNVDKFVSGFLPVPRNGGRQALAEMVRRNNDLVRQMARDSSVILVDAAALSRVPGLLRDDCHFTPEGEQAFADLLAAALADWMRERAERAELGPGESDPAGPRAGGNLKAT